MGLTPYQKYILYEMLYLKSLRTRTRRGDVKFVASLPFILHTESLKRANYILAAVGESMDINDYVVGHSMDIMDSRE